MAKKTMSEIRKEPGMSNAGKYKDVSKGDFCGPKGTFPVNSLKRAKSALKLAHNAKDPEAIKSCVYTKFPQLKKGSKMSRRKDGPSISESPKPTTAAQRRKAAQDKAMGDNTTDKKGLGRAIEKYKDRNDVVSYTYENERGGTTGVTTTKKKVRKEQRKIERSNPKSNTKPAKGSKAQKITKVKYKKPKNAKYGIQKGRVNKQRMRKK